MHFGECEVEVYKRSERGDFVWVQKYKGEQCAPVTNSLQTIEMSGGQECVNGKLQMAGKGWKMFDYVQD